MMQIFKLPKIGGGDLQTDRYLKQYVEPATRVKRVKTVAFPASTIYTVDVDELVVRHNLNRIPTDWKVVNRESVAVVYRQKTGKKWTRFLAYLTSNTNDHTVKIEFS